MIIWLKENALSVIFLILSTPLRFNHDHNLMLQVICVPQVFWLVARSSHSAHYANTDLDDDPQTVKKSKNHFMWDIKVFIFIFTDTLEVHPQTDKTESACAHKKAVARGKTSY